MRELFLKREKELAIKDANFRESLSLKTTIDTSEETWFIAPETGRFLYDLILKYQPLKIVEVGTSLGYSTIWMAEAASTYGGQIDTYETEKEKIKNARMLFHELGFDDTITIHHMEALPGLQKRKDHVDLLFLDARKREYGKISEIVNKILKIGGYIIADDVTEWRRKLDDFFDFLQNNNYEIKIEQLGHGLLVAKKK